MRISTKDTEEAIKKVAVTVIAGLALRFSTRALESLRVLAMGTVLLGAVAVGDATQPLNRVEALVSPNSAPVVEQNCPADWRWLDVHEGQPVQTCAQGPLVMTMVPYQHTGERARFVNTGGDSAITFIDCNMTPNWPVSWC